MTDAASTPEPATWYEVEASKFGTTATIRPVRVLRETAQQIVLADCTPSNARRAKADNYFPTWEEAHKYLLTMTKSQLEAARRELARAQGRHGNVKGMKPGTQGNTK